MTCEGLIRHLTVVTVLVAFIVVRLNMSLKDVQCMCLLDKFLCQLFMLPTVL